MAPPSRAPGLKPSYAALCPAMAENLPRSSTPQFTLPFWPVLQRAICGLSHSCRLSQIDSSPDLLRVSAKTKNLLRPRLDFADVPSADPFEGYEVEEVEDTPVSRSWKLRLAPRRRRPTRHAASLPWQRIGTSPDERHQHLCRPGNHEWCLRPDRAQIWTMGPQDRDYFLICKRQEEAAAARSRGSVALAMRSSRRPTPCVSSASTAAMPSRSRPLPRRRSPGRTIQCSLNDHPRLTPPSRPRSRLLF